MTKKINHEDYYDFFQEIPQPDLTADYLNDIEIQDEYESPSNTGGLSDEQVSQLAHDSLEKSRQNPPTDHTYPPQQ